MSFMSTAFFVKFGEQRFFLGTRFSGGKNSGVCFGFAPFVDDTESTDGQKLKPGDPDYAQSMLRFWDAILGKVMVIR